MDDPDWANVLKFLYDNKGYVELPVSDTNDRGLRNTDVSRFTDELDISEEDIHSIFEFLTNQSLLIVTLSKVDDSNKTNQWGDPIGEDGAMKKIELTPDGFQIAHEREMNKNQTRTNIGIGVLTVFLVVGSLLQGYSAFLTHEGIFNRLLLTAIVIIGLAVGLLVVALMTGYDIDRFKSSK